MGKRKPLVEDTTVSEGTITSSAVPLSVSRDLQGGNAVDPTRNPETVEGSIFPQVPGEEQNANKIPDEGPEFDAELLAEAEDSIEPTADELVDMVGRLLNDFKGQNKLDVIQRIEQVIKRQKSRM